MPSPDTIDIAALLSPIGGDNPSGTSVMFTGPHDQIKLARQSGDRSQVDDKPRVPEWGSIVKLASKTLVEQSKDLQVAAWLTEALTNVHGFPGLRDGLKVLSGLVEGFWDTVFPEIDDGDLSFRASPFNWLNAADARGATTVRDAVLSVPLTDPRVGPAHGWLDWRESRDMDQLALQNPERHQAAIAEGRITGDVIDKAIAASPRRFYEILSEDVGDAYNECARLQAVVRDKFGQDAPSIMSLLQAIEECRDVVERLVKEKRLAEPDHADAPVDTPTPAATTIARPAAAGGIDPVDRTDALRRLSAVATFFKRTEPHSPVAFLVERAVKWGNMPFEDWLAEVINSGDVLDRLRETLGLPPR